MPGYRVGFGFTTKVSSEAHAPYAATSLHEPDTRRCGAELPSRPVESTSAGVLEIAPRLPCLNARMRLLDRVLVTSTQYDRVASSARATGSDGFARLALRLDAVVTGLNGIAYLALATVLESFFGVPTAVQYPVGVFLLLYSLGVLALGTRKEINRTGLTAVIVANLLWVVLSLVAVGSGLLSPTGVGAVWTVLQSLVVGGFAALQYVGLKRL